MNSAWQDYFQMAKREHEGGNKQVAFSLVTTGMIALVSATSEGSGNPYQGQRVKSKNPSDYPEEGQQIPLIPHETVIPQPDDDAQRPIHKGRAYQEAQKSPLKQSRTYTEAAEEAFGGKLPDKPEPVQQKSFGQLVDDLNRYGSMQQGGGDFLRKIWPLLRELLNKVLE